MVFVFYLLNYLRKSDVNLDVGSLKQYKQNSPSHDISKMLSFFVLSILPKNFVQILICLTKPTLSKSEENSSFIL